MNERTVLPPNPVALRLGYAGLIPFVLGTILTWLVRDEAHVYAVRGLTNYAAVIVSFLGAIHWGLAFRQSIPSPSPYVWGVVPSLVAWVASMMQPDAGLVVHGVMLIVCYLVDRRLYPAMGAGAWLTLRFRLSAVAALCCFLAAQATLF
ncbi:DUF3429 domain-containing protein [Roseateles depolymerans]|uniref:Uncharacterized protein n=1 Tax=Roseateles depolymerans TaxID=76731 RepID=A0A0U3MJA7_9BURK|nr:DUF3429 domain-containing protein [Roseateles depolymerans]ALV08521.1 hypothetical protein RD2015_4072 [Roseateles depolymerans]REG21253.1 uncharacterized protein DUF3429 [Roseateles depolymerans]